MQVKICGLTRRVDAELATTLGASFLGVIMAGGPRHLSVDAAREVLGPRRHTVRRAVVFATQPRTEIALIASELALDVIQLHGNPSVADIEWLRANVGAEVWPVVRVSGATLPSEAFTLARAAGAVLLDAKVDGQLGGTGVTLDWQSLRDDVERLRDEVPDLRFILAGGLRPENLAQAKHMLNPEVIDVSSGVELSPGIKNPTALRAFLDAAGATANHG